MRTLFGVVNEVKDLGVVAEHCPHCDSLQSCLLRKVTQGHYFCFIKFTDPLRESSCLCTNCLKAFPGKPRWAYACVVPVRQARGMDLNEILTKTNPILADRIQFKEKIRDLGGDERFAIAYDKVEGMRPGVLRSQLLQNLLTWPQLSESQRAELDEQIGVQSRAWRFARQMAVGFPTSSGTLPFFLSIPMFGLILICMLVTRRWIWGGIALAASVVVATVIESFLFKQSVRKWTRQVLIPEAQEANVPLDQFVAVIDDIPESKLGLTEELWPMKQQLQNIRQTLLTASQLPRTATPATY